MPNGGFRSPLPGLEQGFGLSLANSFEFVVSLGHILLAVNRWVSRGVRSPFAMVVKRFVYWPALLFRSWFHEIRLLRSGAGAVWRIHLGRPRNVSSVYSTLAPS
jgi:hypothetical protein